MRSIVLIAHDIRSTHNVGSLLRTAECFGVKHVYFTGYSPYPISAGDERLPHIAERLTRQIHKTSLGTESMVNWSHENDVLLLISQLKESGFTVIGLEQHQKSVLLSAFTPPEKIAILVGREVEGIAQQLLEQCDVIVEIPQFGKKESLNVVQATAIALYHCATVL